MLGASTAVELGLARPALAEQLDGELTFGDLEPLVCLLQETPLGRVQGELVSRSRGGLPLKTLTAAGALANARTFGGDDYLGFDTFITLAPALRMSSMMQPGAQALPVLKVLYRNTKRIQECGGRSWEVLHPIQAAKGVNTNDPGTLRQAIRERDAKPAEEVLAAFVASDRLSALEELLPSVREPAEVHRVVLKYRAWGMQQVVGTEHHQSLLGQLDRAIRGNMQGPATSIAQHYGTLALPAEPVFELLAGYAVSENGALHAEKYFQAVWDDFHIPAPPRSGCSWSR